MEEFLRADRGCAELPLKALKLGQVVFSACHINHLVVDRICNEAVLDILPAYTIVSLQTNDPCELGIAIVILDVFILRLSIWLRLLRCHFACGLHFTCLLALLCWLS